MQFSSERSSDFGLDGSPPGTFNERVSLAERCRFRILHLQRPDFPQLMRLRKGKAKNLNADLAGLKC